MGRSSKVSRVEEHLAVSHQTDWHSPWHHPYRLQSWDSHVLSLFAFCQQSLHWQSWLKTPPKVQVLPGGCRTVAWSPSGTTARGRGRRNPSHLRMNCPPASPREGSEHHFGSPSLDFEKTVLFSHLLPPKIQSFYLNFYLNDLPLVSAGSSCWLLHSFPGMSPATLVYGHSAEGMGRSSLWVKNWKI